MANSVKDQVIAILAQQALREPAEVTLDQSLADLGLDSLGLVEAIFAIEETFDVAVPFNANDPAQVGFDLSSVGAVVAAVEALLAARAA
ncbi:acyl carrier protein [Rhodobacter ferrooxidans]|uniref:Phosphopantetheine-binding n=1 Tax=Rhodobacter ferrooxidans TaxID=371731 RepID=C8RZ75_9RHOB|nr:acyl carrier protein [Rhodobacter sp. SW2]EEW26032.1 phosphopantetheine-binding [Rhodobacter sp. SW2]